MKITFTSRLLLAAVMLAGGLLTGCQKDPIEDDPALPLQDQMPAFSKPHGLVESPFQLTISPASKRGTIYYTLDGSAPTENSIKYKKPLSISGTTIIRAVEKGTDGSFSKIATASYLFEDVLDLSSTPEGYPEMWGPYCQIDGRATADYAMDPSMTKNTTLRQKMKAGLKQIPIVSIVTDKDFFFKDSTDPDTGGIYIHTGTPVGDNLGRGWERPVSVEMFDGGKIDLTENCGICIHGGHSRLPEKNPKHALRLKFKSKYGVSKLKYPVFGEDGPGEFNTLTLRTFFGNSWQHWESGNRKRAQYERDLWHRMASAQLGMPYSTGRHVHVFLNGIYWGIYSLSERIDENFCKTHFGGKKEDYDVIKVDEEQGNKAVADAGSIDAFAELMALDGSDLAAVERLLDVDEFIDFMILNQFAGNTDWDYHNWYALYNRGAGGEWGTAAGGGRGFRFLVWDSESIFQSVNENILDLDNKGKPTGLFQKLIKNPAFRARFSARVHELSSPGGLLTTERVVALWDSLYHSIDNAIYLEAARWGDYRYAVHPYQTQGKRYDVDNYYMDERNRLLRQYFPARLDIYLQQLRDKGWLE
jgi:hypothetical protein